MKLAEVLGRRSILYRSAKVALVVGTILNLINQPGAFLGGESMDWFRAALTYCVPFAVSMYGACTALAASDDVKPL